MAKDLLIEIGLEEVPARFLRGAMEQLADKTRKWLDDARISYETISSYATPRRIAVIVKQVAERQEDISETVKGPAKKIAIEENGNWSKAAQGFARSQGVSPDDLFVQELAGIEYVYAKKSSIGVETAGLLGDGLEQLITTMTFPKNMRWGDNELRFVRPIKWLAVLFGDDVIDIEIVGVKAGRTSQGHRFLGGTVQLASPADYIEGLRTGHVIVDVEERKQLIVAQIKRIADENGWRVSIPEDLLEEVLFLVEYPTALYGGFDEDFLHIPQEVLITSMREHQRYFPVFNEQDKLLPYFITVRNGNDVSLNLVAKGNEKVLRARLSDARFFYAEDQKLAIDTALSRLESVVFHEELGTVGDKVRRIGAIAEDLARILEISTQELAGIKRTAAICKFDLVTQMVYEFPELQGVMGKDYAGKFGEQEAVAAAIDEHYQPRFSGDASPASLIGAIVSIADKIDTIVGCFSIGIIPTGSQDPYALRRQAAGIVQIVLDHRLPVTLRALFDLAIGVHQNAHALKREAGDISKDLYEFFGLRVKNVLSASARYDVVDAVMAAGYNDIASVVRKGHAIMEALQEHDTKTIVESFTRVSNLAAKAETEQVDTELFAEEAERVLYHAWQSVHAAYIAFMNDGEEAEALAALAQLRQPVTQYFDAIMVMAEDLQIRRNRLALLALIAADLQQYADFHKLVWS